MPLRADLGLRFSSEILYLVSDENPMERLAE